MHKRLLLKEYHTNALLIELISNLQVLRSCSLCLNHNLFSISVCKSHHHPLDLFVETHEESLYEVV